MVFPRRATVLALALLIAACGSTPAPTASPGPTLGATPTPSPSPSPSPSPTPLPSPVTGSIPVSGGTVNVPGGASLTVGSGILQAPATATITAQAPVDSPTQAWPADPVGPAWLVDLGGIQLAKPVTLSIAFDAASLPTGTDPAEIMLAYQDAATGSWVPVPATVNPVAHTVTASVSHLSSWGLFTINWDYWLGFIAKAASGNLTDLLGALGTLTTPCAEKSAGFVVDNSGANGMVKGCVQKVVNGTATIGVTNMKLISFALSGGALDVTSGTILDAGDTVTFTAGGAKLAQPLVAEATLSPLALGYQMTDITLRMLPGSDVFTKAGSYGKVLAAIATAEAKVWSSAQILSRLQKNPPDLAGAAEEAFSLMTDHSFLGVFVNAAVAAGQEYSIPYLSALTPARLNRLVLAVNLLVLDTTVLSWDLQYFLAAYGDVKVTWPTPPPAPTGLTFVDVTGPDYAPIECSVPVAQYGQCGKLRVTWQEAGASPDTHVVVYYMDDGILDCFAGPCNIPPAQQRCAADRTQHDPSEVVEIADVSASLGSVEALTPPPFGLKCVFAIAKNSVGKSDWAVATDATPSS